MRRWMTMLLLLLLLPACALAAPETPYAPETVFQTAMLSDGALAALNVIYPGLRDCSEAIDLPDGTLYEDVSAVMTCLTVNYPELFHLKKEWTISYYQDTPQFATILRPGYTMDAGTYNARLSWLMETVHTMAGSVAGAQADRAEALHDLLCERTVYDRREMEEIDNTAFGALYAGLTQCEGYAQALALLYRMAGIPCGVVVGETVNDMGEVKRHAWNAAVIDGTATLIDVTWNDQDEGGCVTHWYSGVTAAMMAADHTPDPVYNVSMCDSLAVNWHARRGLLISTREELLAALRGFAVGGEVSLRFADAALFADFHERLNDWLGEYNDISAPGETFYGSYIVNTSEEQLCIMLRQSEGEPEA